MVVASTASWLWHKAQYGVFFIEKMMKRPSCINEFVLVWLESV